MLADPEGLQSPRCTLCWTRSTASRPCRSSKWWRSLPNATVQEAWNTFREHRLHALPIIRADSTLAGVVDVRDMVGWLLSKIPKPILKRHRPRKQIRSLAPAATPTVTPTPAATSAAPADGKPANSSHSPSSAVSAAPQPVEHAMVRLGSMRSLVKVDEQTQAADGLNLRALGEDLTKTRIASLVDFSLYDSFPPLKQNATVVELLLWFASGEHRSPVTDKDQKLVGMLTQTAVVSLMAQHLASAAEKKDTSLNFVAQKTMQQLNFVVSPFSVPSFLSLSSEHLFTVCAAVL